MAGFTDVAAAFNSVTENNMKCPDCDLEMPVGRLTPLQANAHHSFQDCIAEMKKRLEEALHWEDVDDEWSKDITAAFPTRSDSHEEYALAMKMVGNRHSKGELVSLVNWLLVRVAKAERELLGATDVYRLGTQNQQKRVEDAVERYGAADAHAKRLQQVIDEVHQKYCNGIECEMCALAKALADEEPTKRLAFIARYGDSPVEEVRDTDAEIKRGEQQGLLALALGYNELAKHATRDGDKVYWRLMRTEVVKKLDYDPFAKPDEPKEKA